MPTSKLSNERLSEIWKNTLADREGKGALRRLKEFGFSIEALKPNDATFHNSTWADYVAAIPLLDNRPSKRTIRLSSDIRKFAQLAMKMRLAAQGIADPFTSVTIKTNRDKSDQGARATIKRLISAAETIEEFLSWEWLSIQRNPRNAVIASLRWEIRFRTGAPRDRELNDLLAAVFRAAGFPEGFYLDPAALDRIEKREKEVRMKAFKEFQRRIEKPTAIRLHY